MATVTYNWQAPTSGPPDTYNIYEGTAAGNETLLASVAGNVLTYIHTRAPGPFSAVVKAVTGGVETGPSNEFTGAVAAPPAADFALTYVCGNEAVDWDSGAGFLLAVAPLNGFSGGVTLTLDNPPPGLRAYSFIGRQLIVTGAEPGSYTLTVRGTAAGSLTHTVSFPLTVGAKYDRHSIVLQVG